MAAAEAGSPLCALCAIALPVFSVVPCGHPVLCEQCVLARMGSEPTCPVCNASADLSGETLLRNGQSAREFILESGRCDGAMPWVWGAAPASDNELLALYGVGRRVSAAAASVAASAASAPAHSGGAAEAATAAPLALTSPGQPTPGKLAPAPSLVSAGSRASMSSDGAADEGLGPDYLTRGGWVPPRKETALARKRGRVFARGEAPYCCTSLRELEPLGVGTSGFFRLLCALTLVFVAMLAASAPAFVMYAAGRRVPLRLPDPIGFARISLGNIGPVTEDEVTAQKDNLWLAAEQSAINATGAAANSSAVTAAAAAGALGLSSWAITSDDLPPGYMSWLGSLTFLDIRIAMGPLTGHALTLTGNVAAWVVTGSDAAVMLIVAIAFLVLRARLVSGSARASATRVSLADYSVMVRGLPRDVGAAEVRDHFSRLFALDGSGCDAYGNPPVQSQRPAGAAAAGASLAGGDRVIVIGGGIAGGIGVGGIGGGGVGDPAAASLASLGSGRAGPAGPAGAAGFAAGSIRSIRLAAASTRFALASAAVGSGAGAGGQAAIDSAGATSSWATVARRQSSKRREASSSSAASASPVAVAEATSPAGAAGPASPSAAASSYAPVSTAPAAPAAAPLPKKALVELKKKLLRRARAGIVTAADGNVAELTDRLSAAICYARVASIDHLLPAAPPGMSLASPLASPGSTSGGAGGAAAAWTGGTGGDPSPASLASPGGYARAGGKPSLISPSAAAAAGAADPAAAGTGTGVSIVMATPVPGRFGAPRTVRLSEAGPPLQITVVPAAGASPLDYTRDVPGPLSPARSPARSAHAAGSPSPTGAALAATATAASLGGLTLSPAAYAAAVEAASGFLGSWVADVHLVMDDRAELAAYLARQSLLAQLRLARAEVKMYSAGTALRSGPDPARRMRALRRAEKLEFKLAGVRATIEAARAKRVQAAEATAARAGKGQGHGKGGKDGATGFGRNKLSPAAGTASASVSVSVDVGEAGRSEEDGEANGQQPEPNLGLAFVTFNNEESAVRCVRAYGASAHVPGCLRRLVQDKALHFSRQRDIAMQAAYDAETVQMQAAAVWRTRPGGPGPPPEGARLTTGTGTGAGAAASGMTAPSAAHIQDWAGTSGLSSAAPVPVTDLPGMASPALPPAPAPAAAPPTDRASARAAAKAAKAIAKWEKADKAAEEKWIRMRRKERPGIPSFALHVSAAPDASNVVHENLGVSSTSRCMRVAATSLVGLLLLAAAFAAMVAGKVYGQRLSASLPDFGLCGSEIPALYFGGYENASAARLAVAAGYGGIVVDTPAGQAQAVVRGGVNGSGLPASATALLSVEDGLPLLSLSRSPDAGSRRLEDNSCAVGSISLAYRYDFRGAMPLASSGSGSGLTGLPATRVPIINGTLQLATPTSWALAAAYNPSSVQHLGTAVPYAGMADACDGTSTRAYIAALPAAVQARGGSSLSPVCPDPRRRPPQPVITAAGATGSNPALTPAAGSGFCQCVVPDDTSSLCPTLPCFQPSLVSRFRTCRTFPAATLAGCFCLYTLQQYIALQGPAAGFLAFSTGERDVCGAFADAYAAAQAVILGTAAGAAVVNMLLGLVMPMLVAAERHVSVSAQSQALVVKVAAAQAVNTLLTAVVVNAGFGERVPAVLATVGLFGGGFDDMTTAWYASVGSSICLTLAISALLAPVLPLLEPLFACLSRCRMRHADGTARTQAQMDSLFVGQPYDAGRRYPAVLLQLFGALVFGAAMPVLYGVAAVSFALTFLVDRWLVFRFAARPPVLDASLIRYTVALLPLGLLLHATIALWAFTAGGLLPLTPLSAATGANSDIAAQLALMTSASGGQDPFAFVQRLARLETLPQAAMLALVLGVGAIRILLVGGVSTFLSIMRVLTCGCICCRGCCTRRRGAGAGSAAGPGGGAGAGADGKDKGLALPAISGRDLPFAGPSTRDVPMAPMPPAAAAAGQTSTIIISSGGVATAGGGTVTVVSGGASAPGAAAPHAATSGGDSLLPPGSLPVYLLYPHAAGLRVVSLVRGAVLLTLRRLAPVTRALYLESAALRLLRRSGLIGPASGSGVPSLEGARSGQGKGLSPFTAPFSRFQDARALPSSGGVPRLSKLNVSQGWRLSKLSANCFADALAGEARADQERLAASGVSQREVMSLLSGRIFKASKASGKAGAKRPRGAPSRRGLPAAAGAAAGASDAGGGGGAAAAAARSSSKRAGRSKSSKAKAKGSSGGCCGGGAATDATAPSGPGRATSRRGSASASGGGIEMTPTGAGAAAGGEGEGEGGRSRSGSGGSHSSGSRSEEGSGSEGEWEGSDDGSGSGSGSGSEDGEWEGSDAGSDAGSHSGSDSGGEGADAGRDPESGEADAGAARTRSKSRDSGGGAAAAAAAKAEAEAAALPVGQPYPLPEDDDDVQSARLGGGVWVLRKLREEESAIGAATPGLESPSPATAGATPVLREMLTWQVVAEQGLLRYDHMVNPVYKAAVEAALEAAEGE